MADTISIERRSALMSRIKSKDTKPEMAVRRLLHSLGYRYVLHDKQLPGRPDLVFPSRGKVIFIHGCFWHGHDCGRGFRPATNADFWDKKIDGNKSRDRRCVRALRTLDWKVLIVFECATHLQKIDLLQQHLVRFLEGPAQR